MTQFKRKKKTVFCDRIKRPRGVDDRHTVRRILKKTTMARKEKKQIVVKKKKKKKKKEKNKKDGKTQTIVKQRSE